ncbi:hypothetical protein BBJ28_00012995 [Nothophytophthora sp. Chile5]|nr:hypothetical protein BBJ28_00012995 [Nothophytophthora sp. Chile5]
MDGAASTHDDEMLALTLGDCEDRSDGKSRVSAATARPLTDESAAFDAVPFGTLPASPTLLPLAASPSSSRQQQALQAYFQSEPSGDFSVDLQKSNEAYRRLSDAMADQSVAMATPSAAASTAVRSKKRKGGANVSIDLQTKIRLIELAEQYQYDPKGSAASRAKPSLGQSPPGQGQSPLSHAPHPHMSGIRLAAHFGLNKSTVSRILKRKEEFKQAYYRDNLSGGAKHINKKSKFEKLNRLVETWFDASRAQQLAVSDTHLRDVGKRFAEELGILDFRGSNGWVRSLRNRKEPQGAAGRHGSALEAQQLESRKKDAEAVERMRRVFPNGRKDLAGFFKDLATYLDQEEVVGGVRDGGSSQSASSNSTSSREAAVVAVGSYTDLEEEEDDVGHQEDDDGVLKKKMVDTLRGWSQELMEAELAKLKKRIKPRQAASL